MISVVFGVRVAEVVIFAMAVVVVAAAVAGEEMTE